MNDANCPYFVLTSGGTTKAAYGVSDYCPDPHEAAARLRAGQIDAIVGALPFDLTEPAALTVPERLDQQAVPQSATCLPSLRRVAEHPTTAEHVERVRRAIDAMGSGQLEKVVLARGVDFAAAEPISPLDVAAALRAADLDGNSFAVHLATAPGSGWGWLVGSSPEVLVELRGGVVRCHPFAGTATTPEGLLDSAKDRAEHAYVVNEIAAALAPLCPDLEVPAEPTVTRAGPVWHLGTEIVGRVQDSATTALDLALALHPTAAVCGVPRAQAAAMISSVEGPRGFYAGAVGWTDAGGDGHWRVAIRCAEITADGLGLRAFAGGGIVATSDPHAELAETSNKLRTVLAPFQVSESDEP